MRIGVDYYPEQWDETMWEQDADRMKEIGVEIVRVGEFAWSRMEPTEGDYDFEWLDRVVQIFTDREIDLVLCTPTCTPPQWAFEKYPEIIQVGADGAKIPIGIRGHRCVTNATYRRLCEKIIQVLVERYHDNPGIIAYQIDNEVEANHCRCEECTKGFRAWMQKKYGTPQAVNAAYRNTVWSGEYSSWEEVKPPTAGVLQWQNPSLTLDYNRYASDSIVDYIEFQRQCIRKWDATVPITTNNWFCENMPDFYDLFEHLDFVSYDNYPLSVLPEDEESLYSHAFHLDLMRGIKQQNFWIMEQLSGAMGSWMPMSPTPRPGMILGYAAQAFAHGADTVLHFRWRTACSGAEMYWHGILDHNNVPGRRYREFAELCSWAKKWKEAEGAVIQNEVAILYGSAQEYAFKLQHQAEGMYYLEQLKLFHDAFTSIGVGVDIINETASLEQYRIVIAPTLLITNEEVKDHLYHFAEDGGSVVLTNRCGMKDSYNCCIMQALPTVYEELAGVRVEEYDVIGSHEHDLQLCDSVWKQVHGEQSAKAMQWCDILAPTTAKTMAVYGPEGFSLFYGGSAAVTCNEYGEGRAYYVGTVMNRSAYHSLAQTIAEETGVSYRNDLPLGVEVTVRKKGQKKWTFVFNNTMHSQKIWTGDVLQPFEMQVYPEK